MFESKCNKAKQSGAVDYSDKVGYVGRCCSYQCKKSIAVIMFGLCHVPLCIIAVIGKRQENS